MIGLDTNILVRYLTQDDPAQSAKAAEIFERGLTPRNPGFVSVVAMVETVWVLDRAYGQTATEIAKAVERMLQIEVLAIENEQQVFTAMVALKQGRGTFADSLIAQLGTRAGCSRTLTFDHKASGLAAFNSCRQMEPRTHSSGEMPPAVNCLANFTEPRSLDLLRTKFSLLPLGTRVYTGCPLRNKKEGLAYATPKVHSLPTRTFSGNSYHPHRSKSLPLRDRPGAD